MALRERVKKRKHRCIWGKKSALLNQSRASRADGYLELVEILRLGLLLLNFTLSFVTLPPAKVL
jgi:hypothetical protein